VHACSPAQSRAVQKSDWTRDPHDPHAGQGLPRGHETLVPGSQGVNNSRSGRSVPKSALRAAARGPCLHNHHRTCARAFWSRHIPAAATGAAAAAARCTPPRWRPAPCATASTASTRAYTLEPGALPCRLLLSSYLALPHSSSRILLPESPLLQKLSYTLSPALDLPKQLLHGFYT